MFPKLGTLVTKMYKVGACYKPNKVCASCFQW